MRYQVCYASVWEWCRQTTVRRPTLRSAILSSAGYNFHTYILIIRRYILFLQKVIQIFFWNNNAEEINRQ